MDHNDPRQALFLQLLLDLHEEIISKSQWELLMTRTPANIGVSYKCDFKDAVRLFAENTDVDRHNAESLSKLINLITCIRAINSSSRAKSIYPEKFRGLVNSLYLAVGADVNLTSNIWQDVGLTNGIRGVVRDIVYITLSFSGRTTLDLRFSKMTNYWKMDSYVGLYVLLG